MKKSKKSVFAEKLNELMKQKNIKAHELGSAVGVSRQAITQYLNDEVEPKMRAFKAIAEYFNVSCDYLLGNTRVAATDEAKQALYDDTGLSDIALNELSLPEPEQAGVIVDYQNPRTTKTLMYREVVNLLLTNPHGKKALQHLADYFFVQGVGSEQALVFGDVKSIKSRITKDIVEKIAKIQGDKPENVEMTMRMIINGCFRNAITELEKILPQDEEA